MSIYTQGFFWKIKIPRKHSRTGCRSFIAPRSNRSSEIANVISESCQKNGPREDIAAKFIFIDRNSGAKLSGSRIAHVQSIKNFSAVVIRKSRCRHCVTKLNLFNGQMSTPWNMRHHINVVNNPPTISDILIMNSRLFFGKN